jgi:hypothetical protein
MHSPLENSPEHITALGTIAARWATLDTILAVVLGNLIGNHAAGEAIYFSSSATQLRIACLRAVVLRSTNLPSERRDRCAHLLENLSELWLSRNTLLHNPAVASSANKDAVFSLWLKRPLKEPPQEWRPLPVANLVHHADRVSAIGDEIFEIIFPDVVRASNEAIERASRDKPPPQAQD